MQSGTDNLNLGHEKGQEKRWFKNKDVCLQGGNFEF